MIKTLFQVSTWNALERGNFDASVSVWKFLRHADTGIGIVAALDGVTTFENGVAYKTAADGKVAVMKPEDGVAFAAAMAFDENAPEIELNGVRDLDALKRLLNPFVQGNRKHRLTRAHREKQLKMSCQALHNAPPNRT